MQHEVGLDVADPDREQWRRQVARQTRAEIERRRRRSPHVDFAAALEEGLEEPEALDVVHVEVAEEHVNDAPPLRESLAEAPHTCPSVEHQGCPVAGANLDTRGVTAVSDRLRAGGRQ